MPHKASPVLQQPFPLNSALTLGFSLLRELLASILFVSFLLCAVLLSFGLHRLFLYGGLRREERRGE